jgi:hypothetical protein
MADDDYYPPLVHRSRFRPDEAPFSLPDGFSVGQAPTEIMGQPTDQTPFELMNAAPVNPFGGDSVDSSTADVKAAYDREQDYNSSIFGKVKNWLYSKPDEAPEEVNNGVREQPYDLTTPGVRDAEMQGGGATVFGKGLGALGLDESGDRANTTWGQSVGNTLEALNPFALAQGGANTMNNWASAVKYPEKLETPDMLAPFGLAAMVAPFAPRAALGSAGGNLRPRGAEAPSGANSPDSLPMDEGARLARADAAFEKPTWYHGTTHDISAFDPSRANVEGHLGRSNYLTSSPEDAGRNYATPEGPDITNRIEQLAERIAQDDEFEGDMDAARQLAKEQIAGGSDGAVMPLRVRKDMNTLRLDKDHIDFSSLYDEAADDYTENPNLLKVHEALQDAANEFHDLDIAKVMEDIGDMTMDEVKASDFDKALRSSEGLAYATDAEGTLVSSEIIRRIYQSLGYDAVEIDAGATFPRMEWTKGARHLMVFDPKHLRSPFAAFDPAKSDSPFLLAADQAKGSLPGVVVGAADRGEQMRKKGFNPDETWYHKTNKDFDEFKPFSHFGSADQANMRAVGEGARVLPVHVKDGNYATVKDTGDWSEKKLKALQRKGYTGVRYLNRYEGIPLESLERAAAKVGGMDKLDALPDSKFKQLVPEAQESLIVFDPKHIKSKFDGGDSGPFELSADQAKASMPGVFTQAAEREGKGPFEQTPKGVRAYHGSPHDFDRFDMSKIGTGEGAQAYGHGLYFADQEDVAKSYRDRIKPSWSVDEDPFNPGGYVGMVLDSNIQPHARQEFPSREAAESWARQAANEIETPGHMYEVNINADPEHFLDWDKPLSQQPGALAKINAQRQREGLAPIDAETAIDTMPEHITNADMGSGSAEAGSRRLREAGIPGIRYLDQGSRGAGEGSRNWVVFDDKIIEILKKYGIIAPPVGAGLFGATKGEDDEG